MVKRFSKLWDILINWFIVEATQNQVINKIMLKTRIEKDLLGERELPADLLWGIHTLRAQENFPISGITVHPELIKAVKKSNPIYLDENKILIRALTDNTQELRLTGVDDAPIKEKIAKYTTGNHAFAVNMVLGSEFLTHIDNDEGLKQFVQIWQSKKVVEHETQ